MESNRKNSRADITEITEQTRSARDMVAGLAARMPALAGTWAGVDAALAAGLALSAELAATRLDLANLLAAARAALAACADGEPDPLWFLRDEIDARHAASQRHGEAS